MKSDGECLRNNWNTISHSRGIERDCRIAFQNNARFLTEEDFDFYRKYMWNNDTEKRGKRKFGKKWDNQLKGEYEK